MDEATIKAVGRARIDRALQLIEQAQNNLAEACSELSSLEGCVPVWSACGKMTDKVHTFWYRVDGVRNGGKYRLDSLNIEALGRRQAARIVNNALVKLGAAP